ncbi:MAG: hypothetical protein Q4B87_02060 [Candidatus Saccharibacteria bacterium]|nr:hypothetical protein [Candidatus Saccharibacteria bacterium]
MMNSKKISNLVAKATLTLLIALFMVLMCGLRASAEDFGGIGALPNDEPAAGDYFSPDGNDNSGNTDVTAPSTDTKPSDGSTVDSGSGIGTQPTQPSTEPEPIVDDNPPIKDPVVDNPVVIEEPDERWKAETEEQDERTRLLKDLDAGEVAQSIVDKYQSAVIVNETGTRLSFWADNTVTVEDEVLGEARVSATVFGAGVIYRMYNPNSGEHFYTKDPAERDNLISVGWRYEPQEAIAPDFDAEGAEPVYRVYNPNSGLHHYTMDVAEAKTLKMLGWNYEGVSFYAFAPDSSNGSPVHRLYCPFPDANGQNQHVYTTLIEEKNYLIRLGYVSEGISWRIRQ